MFIQFRSNYFDENEVTGQNIIFKDDKIHFISINLLLKKIGLVQESKFQFDILTYLAMQLNCVLNIDDLIKKLRNIIESFSCINCENKNNLHLGIIKLLNIWIINEYSDHISKEHLKHLKEVYINILKLIGSPLEKGICEQVEGVKKYLNDKILYSEGVYNKLNKPISIYRNNRKYTIFCSEKFEPILPPSHNLYFDILEWSEVEIARQLTLISSFLINKIKVSEFFFARWTKGEKFTNSPHIMKCIDRFNKLTF